MTGEHSDREESTALVRRVFSRLTPLERVYTLSESELVESVTHIRHLLAASPRHCVSLLSGDPSLRQVRAHQVQLFITTLLQLSMEPRCVLSCLGGGEQVVECEPGSLAAVVNVLCHQLDTAERHVHDMLASLPLLFCRHPRQLRRQLHELHSFFSREQTTAVALRCPFVLLETPTQTRAKIDYLNYEMCLSSDEVARSDGMSAPLSLLRTRHTLLHRLGLYTPVSLKSTAPNRNPPLTCIANMPDTEFCRKIAHCRYLDFQVFCSLIEEEMSEESERQDDDEDSSDEEDMDDTPED